MSVQAQPTPDLRTLARLLSSPVAADVTRLDARMLDRADAHGVTPLLEATLADAGLRSHVPSGVRDRLSRTTREAVVIDTIARHHNRAVLTAIVSAGIDVLVFKGAALAETHYAASWLRPRGDLDLLVPVGQVAAVSAVLERLGCRKVPGPAGGHVTHQARYRTVASGVEVAYDLHWRLVDPEAFAGAVDQSALAAAAIAGPVAGVRMPGVVHALLLACVHRAAHHFDTDRLLLLCDIDRLARSLSASDWDDLTEAASAGAVRAVCARGLERAADLLGTPVPTAVLVRLTEPGHDEPTARFVSGPMRRVDVLRSDLRRLVTWRDRVALVREHLFPPRSYMAARYAGHPLMSPWLSWLLYIDRILRGAGRWFRPVP